MLLAALLSAPPAPAPRPFAQRALIPLSIGAALLAGGGIFLGVSVVQTNEAAALEGEDRDKRLSVATSNRVGGVMLLTTGALVGAIAAFLFWFEPSPRVALSLTPIAGGALFTFGWTSP